MTVAQEEGSVIILAQFRAPVNMHSCFDSSALLVEVVDCIVNLYACFAVVTNAAKVRQDYLARRAGARLNRFKRHNLQSAPQLVNHWTVAVFEDNIIPSLS